MSGPFGSKNLDLIALLQRDYRFLLTAFKTEFPTPRPVPLPEKGLVAFFRRSDGTRQPLYPFVLANEDGDSFSFLWSFGDGRLTYRQSVGDEIRVQPGSFESDFFVEFFLKLCRNCKGIARLFEEQRN